MKEIVTRQDAIDVVYLAIREAAIAAVKRNGDFGAFLESAAKSNDIFEQLGVADAEVQTAAEWAADRDFS